MEFELASSIVEPIIGEPTDTADSTIQALSPIGMISERVGDTNPEISCSTTSVDGETTKFVRAQFSNGPAPLEG